MAKYDVDVKLIGQNGNTFVIMGLVAKALKRAGVPQDEINNYRNEATSGNYDHLLDTTMKWVNVS